MSIWLTTNKEIVNNVKIGGIYTCFPDVVLVIVKT